MIKSKWLRLHVSRSVKGMATVLRGRPFNDSSGLGFELLYRDNLRLSCRFAQRLVEQEEIVDPFGSVSIVETVRYTSTLFHVYHLEQDERTFLLEVVAPSRSLKALISSMDDSFGGISVGEVELDLFQLFRKIKKLSKAASLVKIKASNMRLTNTSDMRVEVLSPTGNAYPDFQEAFAERGYKVDKIKIVRAFGDSYSVVDVSATGLFAYPEEVDDELRTFLQEFLIDAASA